VFLRNCWYLPAWAGELAAGVIAARRTLDRLLEWEMQA
jgi:hypothetical protein